MAIKDRLGDVPVVGTALRVQDRYTDDAGNQLAAAMGFFGFLALFPLLLLVLSVAGFVLADDPARQAEVVRTIESAIPGLAAAAGAGTEETVIGQAMDSITRNPGAVGLVGLVTLVLAGLRIVASAMTATQRVFRIEVQDGMVQLKLRQLGALVGLGLLALAGTVVASSVGALADSLGSPLAGIAIVGGPLLALALDFALFLVSYRVLAAGQGPAWRELVPGALLAATGWTGLKLFGSTYVASQVAKANELYGTLGGVIGLLLLLFLAGRLYVYGAELSAVVRRPGPDLAPRDPEADLRDGSVTEDEKRPSGEHAVRTGVAAMPGEADAPLARPVAPPEDLPGRVRRTLAPPAGGTDADPGALAPAPPAHEPSPAVSAATTARLQQAAGGAALRDPHYVRKALAFAIALGAVGGLVSVMRPGGDADR